MRKIVVGTQSESDFSRLKYDLCDSTEGFYSVIQSRCVSDLVGEIHNTEPDCVLLDESYGYDDYLHIVGLIRSESPFLPVVVLTNQISRDFSVKLVKAKIYDYIVKNSSDGMQIRRTVEEAIAASLRWEAWVKNPLVMVVDASTKSTDRCVDALANIEQERFRWLTATTSHDCFEQLKDNQPHCILLNCELPDDNALNVLKKISVEYPLLPVILLTENGIDQLTIEALKAGAQNYLDKANFSSDTLRTVVNGAITESALQQMIAEKDVALRRSETRLRRVLMGAQDGIWDWPDISKEEVYWSPRFHQLLGYEVGELTPRSSAFFSRVHHDDLQHVERVVEQSVDDTSTLHEEIRLLTKCGEYRWFELKAISTTDKRTGVTHMTGSIADVQDRKSYQEDLGVLHDAIEHSESLVMITDSRQSEIRVTYVNDNSARRMTGYSAAELLGQSPKLLQGEHTDPAVLLKLREALKQGKAFECEILNYKKDGTEFWQSLNIAPIKDASGVVTHFVSSGRDITSSKVLEKELEESRAFSKLITDLNPDLIFVKDSEFRLVEANPAFLSLYPEDQQDKVIGYTTLESYDDEDAEAFLEMDRRCFEEGFSETNETILFPDGNIHKLYTRKIRFENKNGEPFVLGIGRDITEHDELVEKLEASNEELERFAYLASHDLQEPLRMVRSFTDLLKQRYGDRLDENGHKYIDIAYSSAARMQEMVQDMLDYGRLDKEPTHREEVDLNDTLDYVVTNLGQVIEEKNAEIHHGDLPTVICNPVRIARVLQNLISNAIKYNYGRPEIDIDAVRNGRYWQLSVSDNGIGIKSEYCDRIFQPFERLHKKSEFSGTGIGLAICKKIIEGIGGEIWADSDGLSGSTFSFTVPLDPR